MRRKIFSPQSRRKTEKEKDENIWSAEEKKNREGKGGKHFEKISPKIVSVVVSKNLVSEKSLGISYGQNFGIVIQRWTVHNSS